MKKVALINPNWNLHNIRYTTASIRPPKSIPLELTYIAASISDLAEVKIYDAYANDSSLDTLINEMINFNPDLVIVETAPTYLFWRCPPLDLSIPREITKIIKRSLRSEVAIIGPHSTTDPVWTKNQTEADILIQGESDLVFRAILTGRGDLKGVYRDSLNGFALINMESLLFPSFDLLDLNKYEPHAWLPEVKKHLIKDNKVSFVLEFSRGCIFDCIYCLRWGFRSNFRTKNPNQTARELDYIVEKGGRYVYFIDELFNKPSKQLYILLDQLKERNLLFGQQSRPDIMTEELIEKIAESGCIYIEYGLETQDQRIASSISKNIDTNNVQETVEKTKEKIPVVNLFHMNFYSPDYTEILGLTEKPVGEWDPKPIRPYPGTYLGEKLFAKYGIKKDKWEFTLRYIWWLQVETFFKKKSYKNVDPIKNTILFGEYGRAENLAYKILSGEFL